MIQLLSNDVIEEALVGVQLLQPGALVNLFVRAAVLSEAHQHVELGCHVARVRYSGVGHDFAADHLTEFVGIHLTLLYLASERVRVDVVPTALAAPKSAGQPLRVSENCCSLFDWYLHAYDVDCYALGAKVEGDSRRRQASVVG